MTIRGQVMFRSALFVALGSAAFLAAGCGETGKGSVSGKVTINGKPVTSGQITFESQVGKKEVLSTRIRDGEYTTAPGELPVGPAKVSIAPSFESPQGDGPPEPGANDLLPIKKKGKTENPINSKYQNSETSGLSLTIQKGENKFDAKLDP